MISLGCWIQPHLKQLTLYFFNEPFYFLSQCLIGRVMPMGRWSKAAGGARQTASLRQGSNILLPSWSGAGKQLLVFSVYHVEYIPFSRSVTEYQAPGLN